MRIAINGMGRIGRLLMRRLLKDEQFEVVAVNDIMPVENLVYLLKYDSIYGAYPTEIKANGHSILINKKEIPYEKLPTFRDKIYFYAEHQTHKMWHI